MKTKSAVLVDVKHYWIMFIYNVMNTERRPFEMHFTST